MNETIKNKKREFGDTRDISIVKRQAWLQNQVPWKKVVKKDKKWRKSVNRTFRPKPEVKAVIDPFQFKHIPENISEILKKKRENIGLSIQNLAYKSNVHIDKILNFEDRQNRSLFLSNYELYKIKYIIENYSMIKDIKNVKIPLPEGKLSCLSNL